MFHQCFIKQHVDLGTGLIINVVDERSILCRTGGGTDVLVQKGDVVDIDEGNQFGLRLVGSDSVVVGDHAKPKRTKICQGAGGELGM